MALPTSARWDGVWLFMRQKHILAFRDLRCTAAIRENLRETHSKKPLTKHCAKPDLAAELDGLMSGAAALTAQVPTPKGNGAKRREIKAGRVVVNQADADHIGYRAHAGRVPKSRCRIWPRLGEIADPELAALNMHTVISARWPGRWASSSTA